MSSPRCWHVLLLLLPFFPLLSQAPVTPPPDSVGQRWEYDGLTGRYAVEVVATGLQLPFGLAFLPDGRAVVSDRTAGRFSLIDVGTGRMTPLSNGPLSHTSGDAGLLDLTIHPDFARNTLVYYAYVEASDSGNTTVVERAHLRGTRLEDRERLFSAFPAVAADHHFGARLLLHGGYLFITLGERDIRELAQELWTDHGKVIRLLEDGRIPPDNPFVGRPGARPGIWSYGHRNPHGLAVNPVTGELWESEHGPLGGDEVNVIKRGRNYGWPLVSFGREYSGFLISDGATEAPGLEPPIYHYSGSAALSGLRFYSGDAFPAWRGNAFMGAMTPRYLARLIMEPGRPVREERLLLAKRWRIRVVQQGPDGFLYLGVEATSATTTDGKIVRLRPARAP